MKKGVKKLMVSIIQKDLFASRLHEQDNKIGEFLYDFIIKILEAEGEESEHCSYTDVQMFTYKESSHGKQRHFLVSKKLAEALKFFRFESSEALEEFGKVHRLLGKNILLQLNSGEISMKDFEQHQ